MKNLCVICGASVLALCAAGLNAGTAASPGNVVQGVADNAYLTGHSHGFKQGVKAGIAYSAQKNLDDLHSLETKSAEHVLTKGSDKIARESLAKTKAAVVASMTAPSHHVALVKKAPAVHVYKKPTHAAVSPKSTKKGFWQDMQDYIHHIEEEL